MKRGEYDVMAAAEDRLWWYRGLRRLVVRSLTQFLPAGASPRIVDVGCGTGGTFQAVSEALPGTTYVGFDIEPAALDYSRRRGLRRGVLASASALPMRAESAEAVICLDVLYYSAIEPRTALKTLFSLLRPGGILILNLPAFEILRGQHDLAVGISRRFRRRELCELCDEAGFHVRFVTYWNASAFLPLLAWRRLSRIARSEHAVSDTARSPWWLNGVLGGFIMLEIGLLRWIPPPFGSSVFAVASRPVSGAPEERPL